MDGAISDVQQVIPEAQKLIDLAGFLFNIDVLRKC